MKRKLSELTDYEPEAGYDDPVTGSSGRLMIYRDEAPPKEEKPSSFSSSINNVLNQLFRPDEKRYQLWPEKIIREGLTAAGDVVSGKVPTMALDPVTGEVHTSPEMIEKAQAISALAGTGGLAGGAEGAALNATPSLRPALKHKERLYKGKPGQEHQDIIPKELYDDFSRKAMSGEDLAEYNFGFINDKGHFLNREDALKYGIDTGLIDPHSGRFGALTTTLMADSSKPGTAIEAMKGIDPVHFKSVDAAKFRLGQLQRDKAASKKAGDDVDSSDYMFYNTQIRALKDFIKANSNAENSGYKLVPIEGDPFK